MRKLFININDYVEHSGILKWIVQTIGLAMTVSGILFVIYLAFI